MKSAIPIAFETVTVRFALDAVTLDAIALAHYLCETGMGRWPDDKFRSFCAEIIDSGIPSSTVARIKDIHEALSGERINFMIDVNDKPHAFDAQLSFIYDIAHSFKELCKSCSAQNRILAAKTAQDAWALLSIRQYFYYAGDTLFRVTENTLNDIIRAVDESQGATKQ